MHRYVSRRAALEDACFRLASSKAPQLPLFRAVADCRIAVVGIYSPGIRWPAAALARVRLPTVVLIGADIDGPEPDRPAEQWICRGQLSAWARAAIIHGAGGDVEHYRLAVSAVERCRRLAFIECRSEHVQGWAALPWCRPPFVIEPSDQPHPVAPRPEAMH